MSELWMPIVSAAIGGATAIVATYLAQRLTLRLALEERASEDHAIEVEYQRTEKMKAYVDLIVAVRHLHQIWVNAQPRPSLKSRMRIHPRNLIDPIEQNQVLSDLTSASARVQLIGGDDVRKCLDDLASLNDDQNGLPDPVALERIQKEFIMAVRRESKESAAN